MLGCGSLARWSFICAFAILTLPALLAAQNNGSQRAKSQLQLLDDKAVAAGATRSPEDVRRLTEDVLNHVGFDVPANSTLRDRLARAEQEFQEGNGPGVSEGMAVAALNRVASLPFVPHWVHTNSRQFHMFRSMLKPAVRHFVGTGGSGREALALSRVMSPAEALFVSTYLFGAKLRDESYRIDPDTWVAQHSTSSSDSANIGRGRSTATPSKSNVGRFAHVAPDASDIVDAVNTGLRDEDSEISKAIHSFLDDLGLRRY